jgi:hypothetical protein
MHDVTLAQPIRRSATCVVLAAIMLGTTSAAAIAAPTGFDKAGLSLDASGAKQTLTLSTTEDAQVTGAAMLVGPAGSGAAPAGFTMPSDNCGKGATVTKPKSIASGGCKVTVRYTGSTLAGAQLTIDTTAGIQSVVLRANAPQATVCASQSTVCGTSLTMATPLSATVGAAPTVQTFDVVNDASAKASLSVASVSASPPFSADVSGCSAVAVGARCTVMVTINPTVAGSFPATLTVTSNDPISPGPSVSLLGIASAAPTPVGPPPVAPGPVSPGTGSTPAAPKPKAGTTAATATRRASVTGFKFSARSIAPGSSGKFKYTLSAPARVTISIDRRLPGKKAQYVHRGSIVSAAAKAGKNGTLFSGKIKGSVLRVGTYRATISTKNAAGTAARRSTTFIIKARH